MKYSIFTASNYDTITFFNNEEFYNNPVHLDRIRAGFILSCSVCINEDDKNYYPSSNEEALRLLGVNL
jgi:hypothetical protein